MAITYKHHTWAGGAGYINLENRIMSRIRVKKLEDGNEIKNLDHDLPVSQLEALTDIEIQKILDDLIAADEVQDAATIIRMGLVQKPVDTTLSDRIKGLTIKDRVGPEVPKGA